MTLYAKWTYAAYDVRFISLGGEYENLTSDSETGKAAKPADPTNGNYVFAGWYTDGTYAVQFDFEAVITEAKTLYAGWGHRVTFESNGGGAVAPKVSDPATNKISEPVRPKNGDYVFIGWYRSESGGVPFDFSDTISESVTLYARWGMVYTVTFNCGNGSQIIIFSNAETGRVARPDDPEKEGYAFEGWYTSEIGGEPFDFETEITGGKTLYARWGQAGYPVTFNYGYGNRIETVYGNAETGRVTRPDDPANGNNVFVDWYESEIGGEPFDFETEITGGKTLYARWLTPSLYLSYNLINNGAEYEVDGRAVTATDIVIPATYSGKKVTRIGAYAFQGKTVTSLYIPNGIESIGLWAFRNFSFTSSTTGLTIPESVTSIAGEAFYATLLTEIRLPSEVTEIGYRVFAESKSLTFADLPGVTKIGNSAFQGCSKLEIVNMPKVAEIGDDAFNSCGSLTGIELPSSVTEIGERAFFNSGLTGIELPSGITAIKDSAFYACYDLESVRIPASVESIGNLAFYACRALTYITVAEENAVYKSVNNCILTKDGATLVVGHSGDVVVPSGVTSIGVGAFYSGGLTSVEIPASVESIGSNAFKECFSLTTITILRPVSKGVIALLNGDIFWSSDVKNIYVPDEASAEAYKTAEYWSAFKSIISVKP
jgi:uncharacterized repeat protein (TIGR02543 family)